MVVSMMVGLILWGVLVFVVVRDWIKIWGQVIPPGTSSFDFNGAVTVPVSGARLRGTGAFTVIVTT